LFDAGYLKKWHKIKGCGIIHNPLFLVKFPAEVSTAFFGKNVIEHTFAPAIDMGPFAVTDPVSFIGYIYHIVRLTKNPSLGSGIRRI
jgi:hypothetical protein